MFVEEPQPTVENCRNHVMERCIGNCPDCGGAYCGECLVPPLRRRQPRRCVKCALAAAGIRTKGRRTQFSL